MRPLPASEYEYWDDEPIPVELVRPAVCLWARLGLLVIAAGIVMLFSIAVALDPYRDGRVWDGETHTQLGLPPCSFKTIIGVPCPSCGMSTSFALLIRGDVWHSLQANCAGTLLATLCLLYVPWALASVVRGRFMWIVSLEGTFIRLLVSFLVLMVVRWVVVVILSL